MSLEALVVRYGVIAVLLGAGIEGEAVVFTAGVLAHRGLMPLAGVAIAAAVGSCIVDQLWFFAGRSARNNRWVARARAQPAFARALDLLERHPVAFVLSFRFIYGMRTVSPIAIGTSGVPARLFVPLNMVAAAIWGPVIAWAGFHFGRALDPLLAHAHEALPWVGGAGAVAVAAFLVVRWIRARRA